jgi:hypothetical protein
MKKPTSRLPFWAAAIALLFSASLIAQQNPDAPENAEAKDSAA